MTSLKFSRRMNLENQFSKWRYLLGKHYEGSRNNICIAIFRIMNKKIQGQNA